MESDTNQEMSLKKRKLSRKMIMAYFHEDGEYCPRTINKHCPEHDHEDTKTAEMMPGGQMDLNSIPGFPGVGGMGFPGGGLPGMPGFGGGMPGIDFGQGTGMTDLGGMMSGADLGFGGDMSLAGMGNGLGLSMPGMGDMTMGMTGGLGFGMGLPGDPSMSGLADHGIGGMNGMDGSMGDMKMGLGLGPGASWPYDSATQMQLSGLSPDMAGHFNEFGGSNIRDSVASRDSGLGIDYGSIDNLANGLNSMGLGGRGFPAYGNQGFPGGGLGGFPSSFGGIPGFGAMPQNGDFVNYTKCQKVREFACSDVYFQGEKGLASLPPGAPASALRYQEELMRLKYQNRQQQARKISLVNAARMLQHRGSQSRSRLSVMMTNNFKQEKEKTEDLEKECKQLRGDIDEQHKIRMEAFEFKMQPIVINEEPSRKANYKIQGAKLQYDIYALCLRLRDTTFRAEHEEKRRDNVEKEVNKLRDHISELKVQISTITKGVPITKIEVRDERKDGRSSSVATSHTARSRKSVKDDDRAKAIEEECSPERREKLINLMEAERKKDSSPDGRKSPLRIMKSQQKSAREILMT